MGKSKAAKIAIVAITVSSSMRVNPRSRIVCREFMLADVTVIAVISIRISSIQAAWASPIFHYLHELGVPVSVWWRFFPPRATPTPAVPPPQVGGEGQAPGQH